MSYTTPRFISNFVFVILVLTSFTSWAQAPNVTDDQGRKQGEWIKLKPNGKKHYKGQFKDDIPYGEFKYYDKTGSLITLLEYLTPDSVLGTHYHNNGKKAAFGYYISQQKEGVWRFYDRTGVMASKENFERGLKNGLYIVYNLNGSISRETYFVNDIENGYRKTFDSTGGLLTEGEYKDAQPDGLHIIYRGGKLNIKGAYQHAVRVGEWIYYDENGKPYKTEHYELGIKTN